MSGRQELLRAAGITLAVSAAAWVLAVWTGSTPGNDGFAALAREAGGAAWLGPASYKPLEWLLLKFTRLPGLDPVLVWRLLGAVQLGMLAALADRLARLCFDEFPAAGLLAAVLVPANPALLELAFQSNSTLTAATAMLLILERKAAGDGRGVMAAIGLFSLSRIDALAAVPLAVLLAEGTRREKIQWLQVWLATALVWLLVGLAVNGSVAGLISNMETYSRAAGTEPMGSLALLVWLRAGLLDFLSDAILLLGAAGVLVLAAIEGRGLLSALRRFAFPVAHVAVVVALALSGRPVFYRFLAPEVPLVLVLAAGGLFWTGSRTGGSPGARVVALMALGLLAGAGYAGRLRDLESLRKVHAEESRLSRSVSLCLARELGREGPATVVVPGRIHGQMAYAFREAPVREVTYEREFVSRRNLQYPPVIWALEKPVVPPPGLDFRDAARILCPDGPSLAVWRERRP